MPLFKKKRRPRDQGDSKHVEDIKENEVTENRAEESAHAHPPASNPSSLKPTFSQKIASCKKRVDHVTELADKLVSENHPDVEQVKERREQLQKEWTGLMERFDEHQLKYFLKDVESTKACISKTLTELSYTHTPTNLPAVETQHGKLEQIPIDDLEERIHTLKAEAQILSEKHEDYPHKLKTAQSDLSSSETKLKQLKEKVAERKLELEHAHKLQVFFVEFKQLADDVLDLRASMAEDDVKELKHKRDEFVNLMEREEHLNTILEGADELTSAASAFAKTAEELKKKEKKKTCCVC